MQLTGAMTRAMGMFEWMDAAGAHAVEWTPGEGDVKIDGIEADQVEAIALTNRGRFVEMIPGDYKSVTVTLTVRHCGPVTHPTDATLFDGVNQSGLYATDTTADPGGLCWAGDARYTVTRQSTTTGWRFYNGRVIASYGEAKEGSSYSLTITFHGKPASNLLPLVEF